MTRRITTYVGAGIIALCVLISSRARAEQPVGPANEPLKALVNGGGNIQLSISKNEICNLVIGVFEKGWKASNATFSYKDADANSDVHKFAIKLSSGAIINGTATIKPDRDGFSAEYEFTPAADVSANSIHVSGEFPVQQVAGGRYEADGKNGDFPAAYKDTHIFHGDVRALVLTLPNAQLSLQFPQPTPVLLQDNRQWGQTFSMRIGPQKEGAQYKKGEPIKFTMVLTPLGRPLKLEVDKPVTIVADKDWIPLKLNLDIEPHSALDFSEFGFHDAPAGKLGRVIARSDGQFVFEKDPAKPRRFYGVNFCFSANYLTHEQSDTIAERLQRLGYNAVRIHHYEGELCSGQESSTTLNPEKLDQLDYLLAAFAKRGIYITTDLFVSRPVKYKDIGMDKPGNVEMDTFKCLVPVIPAAYDNWKAFTKSLLDHVNPYTKLRYADDPALAWLSMINEGMFANFLDRERNFPEWTQAWNAWLNQKYATREALAESWKKELKENEDPVKNTVALPTSIYASGPRVRDCIAFYSQTDREMIRKMTAYLRNDLQCKALITNSNAWTNHVSDQASRSIYDYVDDHFYVDHPEFVEQPWRLPSRCSNSSPIAGGATGGRNCAFTREYGKPFTITEFNYAGPGRFRGVGGILTGAMASLQEWSGVWRFAYAHSRESMFAPAAMDYFNMGTDPLAQAAERASLCLFLRGDMKPAPHSLGIVMTPEEAMNANPMPHLSPSWNWMAWVTKVGTQMLAGVRIHIDDTGEIELFGKKVEQKALDAELPALLKGHELDPISVVANLKTEPATIATTISKLRAAGATGYVQSTRTLPAGVPHTISMPMGEESKAALSGDMDALSPYSITDDKRLIGMLQSKKIIDDRNFTDPARRFFRSETGEIVIDGPHDTLTLDTPRTGGGYAPAGEQIFTSRTGITIQIVGADATVWVSTLDGGPILKSKRMLLTHLTDLQNSGIRYAENTRKTLLDWGKLPYLVRNGQALITLHVDEPEKYKVWALSTGGKRIAEVKTIPGKGTLSFTADVSEGAEQNGARILYEIVSE